MRVLSASDLLTVWERAAHEGPMQRALALLAAACPEHGVDALADLSIGHRDALLLRLREELFGPTLTGIVACPACGEQIEIAVNAADLNTHAPPRAAVAQPASALGPTSGLASTAMPEAAVPPASALTPASGLASTAMPVAGTAAAGEVTVEIDGYAVVLRAPSSRDVMAASQADLASARAAIARRCVVSASCAGAPIAAAEVPERVLAVAEQRLAEADPQAEMRLRLACPACGQDTTTILDIVSFFWREIDAWACRMLREVHTLASAYGWTEDAILALTPFRRQCYLELVGS